MNLKHGERIIDLMQKANLLIVDRRTTEYRVEIGIGSKATRAVFWLSHSELRELGQELIAIADYVANLGPPVRIKR